MLQHIILNDFPVVTLIEIERALSAPKGTGRTGLYETILRGRLILGRAPVRPLKL
jgi:hypothetical protein